MAKLHDFSFISQCLLPEFSIKKMPYRDVSGIYGIYCIRNKKLYIGRSCNIYVRLKTHRLRLRKGKHCNNYLQRSFSKYKESDFVFGVFMLCEPEDSVSWEQFYIDSYESKHTFNLADSIGSTKGRKMPKEAIEKTARASRITVVQKTMQGDVIATYKSMTDAAKRVGCSSSAISGCCKGKRYSASGYIWEYENQEKAKYYRSIREQNMKNGKRRHANARKNQDMSKLNVSVNQYDMDGNFIQTFKSIKDACIELGKKNKGKITLCCKGKRRSSYGFRWAFADKTKSGQEQWDCKPNGTPPKKVIQYTMDNKYIKTHDSIYSAVRTIGKKVGGCVSAVCRGYQNSAYGYKWKYAN